jgi:hypothetical protein
MKKKINYQFLKNQTKKNKIRTKKINEQKKSKKISANPGDEIKKK